MPTAHLTSDPTTPSTTKPNRKKRKHTISKPTIPQPHNTAPSTPKPIKTPHPTHVLVQHTLAQPQWTYIHLSPITSSTVPTPKPTPSSNETLATPSQPPLDPITLRLHLTAALSQYLGDHGAAIPVDILLISPNVCQDIYIRVPAEDGSAVVAAVGGWQGVWGGEAVGYRIRGRSEWLACLVGGAGGGEKGLFDFN